MRALRDSIGNDSGQSSVEFALTLPVIFVLILTMIVFGITLNNYVIMNDATGVAARQVAISRGQTTDPCKTVSQAFYAAAPSLTQATLTFSFSFNSVPATGPSCSSSSTTTGAAGNLIQGAPATVTVTYPCNLTVYGKSYVPNCILTSKTTELIQ